MSDIEKFIAEKKATRPKAWSNFEDRYRRYAIGTLLAEHREKSGLSLAEFAKRVKMQKSALSRLENHGEDVKLSTITRYVEATGRPLALRIFPGARRKKGRDAVKIELRSA